MRKKTYDKSIVREILMIFLMILCAVICALCMYFYISMREEQLYRQLNDKNICASKVYLELDNMEVKINAYSRTMDENYLEDFYKSSSQLSERLQELKQISAAYQPVMDYVRRIGSFNDYQMELWKDRETADLYQLINYVRTSIPVQKVESQNMIVENSSLAFQDCIRQTEFLGRLRVIVWILIILILTGCSILMVKRLEKIISALRENQEIAKSLTEHKWDVPDVPVGYYSELDELSLAMNQMKHEIIHYIRLEQQLAEERLAGEQMEKALVEARLTALRAQVNPHFLFNALNLIGKTAFLEQPEQAMELIEAVSKILRYSLDQSGRMVLLSTEMEIVAAYIFLQKSRFGENLKVVCQIPEEAETIRIPSMIIQPIIENSFKHGFKDKSTITITLRAELSEEYLSLYMEDDGSGFDTSILDQEKGMGIGVRNVQQRLELVYQGKAQFRIESRIGCYTKVTVRIPRGGTYENIDS